MKNDLNYEKRQNSIKKVRQQMSDDLDRVNHNYGRYRSQLVDKVRKEMEGTELTDRDWENKVNSEIWKRQDKFNDLYEAKKDKIYENGKKAIGKIDEEYTNKAKSISRSTIPIALAISAVPVVSYALGKGSKNKKENDNTKK